MEIVKLVSLVAQVVVLVAQVGLFAVLLVVVELLVEEVRSGVINVCAWIGLEVQDRLGVVEMAEMQISFMNFELLGLRIGY